MKFEIMFENLTFESRQALFDIQLVQGDNKEIVMAFNDDAGQPLPLSGYTIRMDIKSEDRLSAPAVIQKTLGAGITVQENNLTISFGSETKPLNLDTYYYDILFSRDGKEARLVAGRIFIKNSITL